MCLRKIFCELSRWPLGRTDVKTCVVLHNEGSSSTSAKLQIWEKQSWSQYLCFSQQVELQRAKFYIFLTLSPSKIRWKPLLGNCPCPELTPKLSLSITWQRATLPGPKHTKHEIGLQSHALMGSMVGFQSPEMLAATTLFISRGFTWGAVVSDMRKKYSYLSL